MQPSELQIVSYSAVVAFETVLHFLLGTSHMWCCKLLRKAGSRQRSISASFGILDIGINKASV